MNVLGYEIKKKPVAKSSEPMTQPPTTKELAQFYVDDSEVTPDEKVFLTNWMTNPPHGIMRLMRNGEVFNPREMRILARSTTAWTCKKKIMDAVCSATWVILPIDSEHPDQATMNQATLFLQRGAVPELPCLEPWYTLISALVMDLLDFDAGVLVKVFSATVPDKLVRLHTRDGSTFFKETDPYGNLIRYWQYNYWGINYGSADPVALDPREVAYLMLNARSDSVYGESILEYLTLIILGLTKSTRTHEMVYAKGGIPSGVMGLEGMNKDDFDAFKEWWKNTQSTKVYKQAMANVPVKYTPLITSFRDLQFLESQHWFAELIYRIYKVPHEGLGGNDRTTKGVLGEYNLKFYLDAVVPVLKRIEDLVNNEIIPHFYARGQPATCKFHFPIIDEIMELTNLEVWTKKWENGAATVNEYRREKGLKLLTWGDYNPMMLKQIQQVSQGLWYGAFDQPAFEKLTGIHSDTPLAILKKVQDTQGASKPPSDESA